MNPRTLIRASGASSILGGVMLAVFVTLHEPGTTDLGLGNIFWHSVESAALVFIQLGLVGMYARQWEQIGWVGLISFVLAFIGNGWFAATGYSEGYGIRSEPFFVLALRISWLVFFGAWMFFGLSILYARILPRGGAILSMIAVPVGFVAAILADQQGHVAVMGIGITFGIGQAWLGWGLTRAPRQAD
jgi:hypothetical protein